MDVSETELINPQRMLVSVSQEPYFKVFRGKNLPERDHPAVFHPKTNELTGVLLRMVDKQGGKKLLFCLITVLFI